MDKKLAELVKKNPFPSFQKWWPMGESLSGQMFLRLMSHSFAMAGEDIFGGYKLSSVADFAHEYLRLVYGKQRSEQIDTEILVRSFVSRQKVETIQSGQFDAVSYAFFRYALEIIAKIEDSPTSITRQWHLFTQRSGHYFFDGLAPRLKLLLPTQLKQKSDLVQLQSAINKLGRFLLAAGYLREHFVFKFRGQVLATLARTGKARALYEMGYPAILPSATYLYQMFGEAQHHSSRMIEELFARIGYQAHEIDFTPVGQPEHRVVELWEIKPR